MWDIYVLRSISKGFTNRFQNDQKLDSLRKNLFDKFKNLKEKLYEKFKDLLWWSYCEANWGFKEIIQYLKGSIVYWIKYLCHY